MGILQFSEHFQMIFDKSNVNKWQTNKTKTIFLHTFQNYQIFLPHPFERSHFGTHTSNTFSNVELFSIFSQTFFETNFRNQNKNNVDEITSCFVDQLSKKYCIYYVSEHLRYCSKINEYWLNKNVCLNIVRPFPTLSCFPFFHKLFLEQIFATKVKTKLLKQPAVLLTSCQKNIGYIMCLNT